MIKAPGGTNLYMDPASDATEEYYACTPALAGLLLQIQPPVGHTHTPHDRIGWSFDVTTDNPRCAPLGLELENQIDVSISIDILQGRLHRSGLSAGCIEADRRWVYIGGLKGLGRQNGYGITSLLLGLMELENMPG